MNEVKNLYGLLLIFLITVQLNSVPYCSSICALCSGPAATDCLTCYAPLVMSASGVCVTNTQDSISIKQLPMDSSYSYQGYQSSSSLSVVDCMDSAHYFSLGSLGSFNYVYKTFKGLGVDHYQFSIFFGYSQYGPVWTGGQLQLKLTQSTGVMTPISYTSVTCAPIPLFGCIWSQGCYVNSFFINTPHASDDLTLNFSSITTLTGQAWGIRDIVIILHKCHESCGTCTANLPTNCLTCGLGLYFSGSICVAYCPFYSIPDTNQCVLACPTGFFLNSINNYCEPCASGCQVCLSYDTCITWTADSNPKNFFYDLIAAWIISSVIFIFLVGFLLWKLCLSRKTFENTMQEEVIDHLPVDEQHKIVPINQSHQQMEAHWVEDIDDLNLTKVNVKRKAKKQILGVGKNELK